MSERQKKKQKKALYLIFGGAVLVMCLVVGLVVMLVFTGGSGTRKKRTHIVTLFKPPPPPKIKELPPPPPEKKMEEIVEEPEPDDTPEDMPEDPDTPPPGELLGLDADGTAGGDSFNLAARKGGRSIIGGGKGSMLAKYAWYTRLVREKLEEMVRKQLDRNGGIPSGELQVIVALRLDNIGKVVEFAIVDSSGNAEMDSAVEGALKVSVMRDPPPLDMPKVIKLKILSKG